MTREEYDANKSWGILTSIDLHNCNPETIRDAEKIKEHVYQLCELINVKRFGDCQVVHFADHDEDVAGFSMVQLIETSLISAHFANKTNHVYFDVFSCKYYDPEIVEEFTKKFYEAEDSKITVVLRK